ncbi:MAG: hypothetical protein PUG60_02645 [Lachnospiraceae bacterium]|nr:hypothetical protein [Lachnospiraceae bacterium]MDY4971771.1 hypothetical protein [Lachnospiraceae bacterium]
MGTYTRFDRHIHIGNETRKNGILSQIGYADINEQMLNEIANNKSLKWIQISDYLPNEAYQKIDQILLVRPDITFRLFHFINYHEIDISFLMNMPHVKRLQIDCIEFKDNPNRINLSVLAELNLKSLCMECFDLRDYEFVQNLSDELEELSIMADTMGPGIRFDCTWLLKYKNLQTLWLGKKARKNLEEIKQLSKLKSLSLRGIKLTDFSFLRKMNLEKLALLWNSSSNLHELAELKSLREIELWRINKLNDISFIGELTNLEIIRLQDLKHVTCLPDLSKHSNLQRVFLIGTGIDIKELPDYLQEKVSNWDDR